MTGKLESVIKKHEFESSVILLELKTEDYLEQSVDTIKTLTSEGYSGVYVSFQRSFENISRILENNGVNTKNLMFVDAASALTDAELKENSQCTYIQSKDLNVDELVRAIYKSMEKLTGEKKFIVLDSLTTITLYKPLSEIMRFSEFLMRTVREEDNCLLILNVAVDLKQKKFIEEIALKADEIVNISR